MSTGASDACAIGKTFRRHIFQCLSFQLFFALSDCSAVYGFTRCPSVKTTFDRERKFRATCESVGAYEYEVNVQAPDGAERLSLPRKRAFLSMGRKEGRYVRVGRFVVWWYGFRRDSELCAVWWLDARHRNATNGVTVKPPWCSPLYSEDFGKHRPYLRLFGWRVLSVKYDR